MTGRVALPRWPTEAPLRAAVSLASLVLALALVAAGPVGLALLATSALVVATGRGMLMARVRGGGVRLTPQQLPVLHRRVEAVALRLGLAPLPDVHWLAGRSPLECRLTRALCSELAVLDAERIEPADPEAFDFLVGRELGRLAAGHHHWRALRTLGRAVPLLGPAWARARELTCDAIGRAVCGSREAALRGLAIDIAGPEHASELDGDVLVAQAVGPSAVALAGGWLQSRPSIAQRVAAIDPELAAPANPVGTRLAAATLLAGGVLAALAVVMLSRPGGLPRLGGDAEGPPASLAGAPAPPPPLDVLEGARALDTERGTDRLRDGAPPGYEPVVQLDPGRVGEGTSIPAVESFASVMDRSLRGVVLHPEFQRRSEGLEPDAARKLVDPLITQGLPLLDDAQLLDRTRLMGEVLALADDATCAAIMRGRAPPEAVTALLGRLDLEAAADWAAFSREAALLALQGAPPPAAPSAEEIQRAFDALLASLPEEEAARLGQGLGSLPALDDRETCWVARTLYGAVASSPLEGRFVLARSLVQ